MEEGEEGEGKGEGRRGRNLRLSGEEKKGHAAAGRELMIAEGPDGEGADDCHLVQDGGDDGDVEDCDVGGICQG